MTAAVPVEARPGREGDVDEILSLRLAARAAVAPQRGGELDNLLNGDEASATPSDRYLAMLDPADSSAVFVGTADRVIVGYAVGRVETLADATRLMTVDELFVTPEARGVGVGRALMDRIVEAATDSGCRGIDARALPGDRETKNFFESFGLVARSIVVHTDLR